MDRREFLKTVPTALACGATLGRGTAAKGAGEVYMSDERNDIVVMEENYAAAVFPSATWGVCAQHMQFAAGCLAGLDSDFPHESLIDIREGQIFTGNGERPDLVIAVANPHDASSWREAQTQCGFAKRAGALTLLFAAHPYPEYRYPFDPRTLAYVPEREGIGEADVVINFVTLNLREEFPRMVYALTHYGNCLHNMDLPDIRAALSAGKRAVYFRDIASCSERVTHATRFACNQLQRSSLARHWFNGGLVLMEANSWNMDEYGEVADRFKQALPAGAPLFAGVVGHYDVDPWMTVHAIVTYDPA